MLCHVAEKKKLRAEIEAELRAQMRNNEEAIARADADAYAQKVCALLCGGWAWLFTY